MTSDLATATERSQSTGTIWEDPHGSGGGGADRRSLDVVERVATMGLVVVAAGIVVYRMAGWFTDDAYITLRFARNIVSGDGWTYNVGDHTANGATSPAYTVAVALLSVPLRAATRASNLIFVASFAAVAGFLWAMFNRRSAPFAGLAATGVLIACPLVLATKGMESLAFVALICAVLWASNSGRDVALGVSAALLMLVRGEGVLLCGVVFLQLWIARRHLPVRAIVAGVLTALPWVVYSLATFGKVFPDTLSAKVAQSESGFWGEGWIFLRGFTGLASALHYDVWLWVVVPLAVLGLVRGCRDAAMRPVILPLAAATVLHVVAYGLVLNVPPYHWYYTWEMFTLSVLAGLAVSWLLEQAIAAARSHVRPTLTRSATWGLAVVALTVSMWVHVTPSTDNRYYIENARYIDMGVWLAANTEPSARIAATEIGVLGWYSERPIVDYLGLLDTTSAEEVRAGDLVSWLEREEPDYWLVHDPLWPHEAPAAAQSWFLTAYRPVFTGEPNVGGYSLVVYERTMPIAEAKEIAAGARA